MNFCARLLLVLFCTSSFSAHSNPFDFTVEDLNRFRAPANARAEFRLWIPETSEPIRQVLFLNPGFNGDGRNAVEQKEWQTFAGNSHLALLGTSLRGEYPRYQQPSGWSGKTIEEALSRLAEASGHPEIATAPWLLWGISAGGQLDYNLTCWKPERVTAFVLNKSAIYSDTLKPGALKVPGLFVAGEHDTSLRNEGIVNVFVAGRRLGAPWAFLLERGMGHGIGRSAELARLFFAGILARKTNDASDFWEGSLQDHSIWKYDPKRSTPELTTWLPDEPTAKLWQTLSTAQPQSP